MAIRRFTLETPAPFRLDLTAWALRRRPHNAIDRFDGTWYRRSFAVANRAVVVAVRQTEAAPIARLVVELHGDRTDPGPGDEDEMRALLHRVLGLGLDLSGFYRLSRQDPRLTDLADRFSGMRPPCFPTVFEALVNAIACQQLSLTVGIHLLNRVAARYGDSVSPKAEAPRSLPGPERLAHADPEDLRLLGFSRSKARAIVTLAMRVESGELDLEALRGADDGSTRTALMDIGGVGRWSAEYTMLRGLGRLHVLPGDDVGARNNVRRLFGLEPSAGYEELSELARSWSPYGGLVYFHLLLDSLAEAGHVTPSTSGSHMVTSPGSDPSCS